LLFQPFFDSRDPHYSPGRDHLLEAVTAHHPVGERRQNQGRNLVFDPTHQLMQNIDYFIFESIRVHDYLIRLLSN
jgi:hypothetical protein